MKRTPLQGSFFEEDYLVRTLGAIAHSPDVALTELVANAWDAGASRVEIRIPEQLNDEMVVRDDGCGMTSEQFRKRWMTLGYDRVRHQGRDADFPPERSDWRRTAYGRAGVGRHGLLCFADTYAVETRRDGTETKFTIETWSGEQPFVLVKEEGSQQDGHGTTLRTTVARNLPSESRIREVLSARFLHDPQFAVFVNGKSVPLAEHKGLIDQTTIEVEGVVADAFFIDSTKAAQTTRQHGVAFWVGRRLVGTPSWNVGGRTLIDGRTRIAKRHTVVVRSTSLYDEVLPDWTGFRESDLVDSFLEGVSEYVDDVLLKLSAERIGDTRASVMDAHRAEIDSLQPSARIEVSEFIDEVTEKQPMISSETISVAVQAVINLEKSRSGSALLEKLAGLSERDVEELDRLLGEWSVRDALSVLDEIDRRVTVLEAIRKLSSDPKVDELHTLHPLVTQARWLFGPEFDSPEFSSNSSLKNAVETVFKKSVDPDAFLNAKRRPDLLVLRDATLCAVATERYDEDRGLVGFKNVLLTELKRGGAKLGRKDVHQATDYVEDLLRCGHLDGSPFIRAFVVGHEIGPKIERERKIGDQPESARITATTYGQLERTGAKRLFSLRKRLQSRYSEITGVDLAKRLGVKPQLPLFTS